MISLDILLVYCLNLLHVRDLHFSDRSKNLYIQRADRGHDGRAI